MVRHAPINWSMPQPQHSILQNKYRRVIQCLFNIYLIILISNLYLIYSIYSIYLIFSYTYTFDTSWHGAYKNTSFECSVCDWIHCFVGQVQCHKVRLSVAFERGSFFKNTCTSLDSVKTMHRFAWICDPETGYSGCVPLKAGFSLMSKSSMDSRGCGIKNIRP